MTRTVDLNSVSREGLPYRNTLRLTMRFFCKCAAISLSTIKLKTTSEQPLIPAGDSDIVITKSLLYMLTAGTRVEPRMNYRPWQILYLPGIFIFAAAIQTIKR